MNDILKFSAENTLYKTNRSYMTGGSMQPNQGSLVVPALDVSSYSGGGVATPSIYAAAAVAQTRRTIFDDILTGWLKGSGLGATIGGGIGTPFGNPIGGAGIGSVIGGIFGAIWCIFADCE